MSTSPPASRRPCRTRLDAVSAGYDGRTVLHQVTADIPESAVTSLVGANGSGKSTLLSAVAGVIKPTSGAVIHRGGPAAFVPQRGAVSDALPLTVRQAVAMARWRERGPWRRLTKGDHSIIGEALERLGIADLAGRQLGELSGGQRQRAFIAQGVAQRSDLLLLDEPCTGLDPEARQSIGLLLTDLVADGTTVVQATHDLDSARSGDHCLLLHAGRLDAAGEPGVVLAGAPALLS
ncbi:putative siderophore transport system ATP-binding protein YusV [Streptomyces sp. YIM 130001]|uniref:zinc ABC transporter ATP-binding protein AztA n=1 Tax=Streptomyces sp. YIM 130001 TaxID=2259644 RepID=UPI000E65CA66|nr:zinc ABC transporter ATP-binding protein AztA [Streptomyces sp. YIM 130001]RII20636.1 putative siderophore transport system ATP-binding protein YusV [Streptomyces sp. YIM 130001]